MKCPSCGTANGPGRVYCGGCARTLGEVCPVCFFVNEPIHRYCGGCARDLLAAPAVRATAIGPAVPAVSAALAKPPVSPVEKRDQGGFPGDLEDFTDLTGEIAPGASAAEPPSGPSDATQSDVDGFFQRLAREGEVEIHPPTAPRQARVPPRRTPS